MTKAMMLDVLALNALRGFTVRVPDGCMADVLDRLYNMGGVKLDMSGTELVERATRHGVPGTTADYLVVNTVGEDVQVTLVLDTPELPVKNETDLTAEHGVLAFVYNATYPDFSELGFVFLAKKSDGRIHRIG